MGVYANGHLIYGFVHTDDADNLFDQVTAAQSEDEEEEGHAFEELHEELQTKHDISLFTVGYNPVDVIAAYSNSACGKGFDITHLESEDIAKTEEYDQKIKAFLQDLGINTDLYKPGWHLLSYMD